MLSFTGVEADLGSFKSEGNPEAYLGSCESVTGLCGQRALGLIEKKGSLQTALFNTGKSYYREVPVNLREGKRKATHVLEFFHNLQ